MRSILFTLFLSLLLPVYLLAQPDDSRKKQTRILTGGFGYFAVEIPFLQLNELNDHLASFNIPQFETPFIGLGGGGMLGRSKVTFGGEGIGLLGKEQSYRRGDTLYRIKLDGGVGTAFLGYTVFQSPIVIQILGGIGGTGMTLTISQTEGASFDEILRDPGREAKLSIGGFHFLGGVNILIPIQDMLLLGFQGGYRFTVTNSDWKYQTDIAISDGPRTGYDGPYVKVIIGFGGFTYEKKRKSPNNDNDF